MKSLKTDLTLFWFSLKALSLRNWKIHTFMNRIKGILYAIVSSSTFGLAPFFTLTLLSFGYSSFEVLTYRWGIASLCLIGFGLLAGCRLFVKPVSGNDLIQPGDRLSEYCQRCSFDNSFYVSFSCSAGHDFFLPWEKIRLGHFGSTPIHSRSNPLIFRQYSRL